MKKLLTIFLAVFLLFASTACESRSQQKPGDSSEVPAVKNDASQISRSTSDSVNNNNGENINNEREDTKVGINNATTTNVTLIVGDTVIPATLNNSKAAQDLISRLPYTVSLSRSSVDYCGTENKAFHYDKADLHNGWNNGDISYLPNGNWFAILFDGANDKAPGFLTIGHIDKDYLDKVAGLGNSIQVTIKLAE